MGLLVGEVLQQAQHLHELALAPFPHAGLQQAAQRPVRFGQLPPLQRRGLVQGRRLPLQQRQVVDGVEDEVVLLMGAGMSVDDLGAAADHHLVINLSLINAR